MCTIFDNLLAFVVPHSIILVLTKGAELTFECYPQLIIQLASAFLQGFDNITSVRASSIVFSLMSATFIVSNMFYDLHTSSHMHRVSPSYYGMISSRTVDKLKTMLSAFAFFLCYIACGTVSFSAFFATFGGFVAFALLAAIFILYNAVKMIHREWYFYLIPPTVWKHRRHMAIFVSILTTIFIFFGLTCSALPMLRVPGFADPRMYLIYVSFQYLLLNPCLFYLSLRESGWNEVRLLVVLFASMMICGIIALICALRSIKREYLKSFVTRNSYRMQTRSIYWDEDYEQRVKWLTKHNPYYFPADQVKIFLSRHWEQWKRDRPAWFIADEWEKMLPKECLPDLVFGE